MKVAWRERISLPFTGVIAVVLTALVVSGCGSDEAARLAEAEPATDSTSTADPDSSAAPEPTATTEPEPASEPNNLFERVTSSNKGTRVCVRNDLANNFEVTFTRADTSDSGTLTPGQTRCGEGTRFVGTDIAGEMNFSDGRVTTVPFAASNPWAGAPELDVARLGPGLDSGCGLITTNENVYTTCKNSDRGFELWRLSDTSWKEFLITVRNR